MSEPPSGPTPRRARPLAELAFEGTLERAGELARRWAIALILDSPPELLGAVPLEDLARDAPALIEALIRALHSEAELEALLGGARAGASPASRIGVLVGAGDPAAVIAAVEALRGILWETLLEQFGSPRLAQVRVRQLAELGDRLASVCAAILPLALGGAGDASMAVVRAPTSSVRAPVSSSAQPAGRAARTAAVIVDERAGGEPQAAEAPAREAAPRSAPEPELAGFPAPAPLVSEPALEAEIEIRDERGDEGPAAWIRSIGRQLDSFREDRISFAVLLVELRGDGEGAWERVEEILSQELRPLAGARLTRERAGRYWLLAPGNDRLGAGALAGQIASALATFIQARRLPLSVAVGTAVCPEDGRRASALAAHADVGLYAARSGRHPAAPGESL